MSVDKRYTPLIGRSAKLNTQNSDLDLTKNELDTLTKYLRNPNDSINTLGENITKLV